ncbi:chemotaxis protein, partial [Mycobacterium sp. MYCO198283]|nr:chemotaxis protein [Mycobacterium sp. MYCO198283]
AAAGLSATGTGAALVSSETTHQRLDEAVALAYELLHQSRMYPGLHWCVGVFRTATGFETVITTNDGAGYIPPNVFVPRSARVLFADPLLDASFQRTWFGWVNPAATMVAYAADRAVLDPNVELFAVAATTDPGGSSVLPARRAQVPHYQDCDSTQSPFGPTDPTPELDDTRAHRLAVIDPTEYARTQQADPQLPAQAWQATTHAVATALTRAERLHAEVPAVVREIADALAKHTAIADERWEALNNALYNGKSLYLRPGFIDVEPSTDPSATALYRAHHNIDRAMEALSLWRGDSPAFADVVYAARQVQKEEELWQTAAT